MSRVLVIGSVNKDLSVQVEKVPLGGETIISSGTRNSLGGKGANQAVALSRMGVNTTFIGKIGKDNNGYEAIESLQNDNVLTPLILKSNTKETGIAIILLEKNGQNRIVVNPGANADFEQNDFEEIVKYIDGYDYYLLQLEISVDFVKKLINYLFEHKKYIILNPAPSFEIEDEILKKVNLIIPNEHEFFKLTSSKKVTDLKELQNLVINKSKELRNKWLVTLGEKGSMFIDSDKVIHCPPAPATVVDTTAAGDTFIAAFIREFAENNDILGAMKFASKASAITISRKGAQESIPYLKEIK